MSKQDRDLTPVLPKKLLPLFQRNMLNYLMIGLFIFTLVLSGDKPENTELLSPYLDSYQLPLLILSFFFSACCLILAICFFFIRDQRYKIYPILSNALIAISALSLITIELTPHSQLAYYGTLSGIFGTILLFISSRSSVIALGARQHATRRLILAECCPVLGAALPLLMYWLARDICYPTFTCYTILILIALWNIFRYIKLPKPDFSAWEDLSKAKTKQGFIFPLVLLIASSMSFGFATLGCTLISPSSSILCLGLSLLPSYFVGKILSIIALRKNKLSFPPIIAITGILASILLGLSLTTMQGQGALLLQCIACLAFGASDSVLVAQLSQGVKRVSLLQSTLGFFFLFLLGAGGACFIADIL